MTSTSGRFVVTFNGEIYNFQRLREHLADCGHRFRGHSDTEVLLACFEEWGVDQALQHLEGMYAFGAMDRECGLLFFVRDRLGEKPLYYGWQGGSFLFGSELGALTLHPSWEGSIDRGALTLLVRHNFIPAPHTIYRGLRKLLPGHVLRLPTASMRPEHARIEKYWAAPTAPDPEGSWSLDTAARELESSLCEVLRDQMIADVPLGAFLSGGVDSATVVALMQQISSQRVRTFTIGFEEEGYDEARHAREVAKHLGTLHTELYVSAKDAREEIPRLAEIYDEPFADSSQIPTILLSRLTRDHVTVALTGDGGDELFCGYPRYTSVQCGWSARKPWSRLAAIGLAGLPGELGTLAARVLVPGQRKRPAATVARRLERKAALASAADLGGYYRHAIAYWAKPEKLVLDTVEPEYALSRGVPRELAGDAMRSLSWLDLHWYLPDDILTKVDRAAMASSLETRIPLLDRRIVDLVGRIPTDLHYDGKVSKRVLREVLAKHVPLELVDRPKQGFAIPLGHWLRGELREWADDLLNREQVRRDGYLDAEAVTGLWRAHLAGSEDHSFELWSVLMFQAWQQSLRPQRAVCG